MAVKSIIDISVNDGEFQRFNAVFQKYQQHLNATPTAWKNIALAQGKSTKAFEELVALEVQSLGHQKMMREVQAAAARLTRTSSDSWREMARTTRAVAGNIKDMTLDLLKWSSLTGLVSGLVGAGGLFGITRMAQGVADQRRSSLGMGASFGELRAFETSFGRFVDTNSFLPGVNETLHSAAGKSALFGAGLKSGDLNGSTAEVGLRVLERARALAKSSNPSFDVETMHARGLDKFMGQQDFQRLRSVSDREFAEMASRYTRNRSAFGVGDSGQLAYQNFVTTIDEASNKISAVFVRGLSPLIPGLEKLSTATTDAVKSFLEAPALKDWIKGASEGLEAFAVQVQRPEFKRGVEEFVGNVSAFVGSFNSFLAFIRNPLAGPPKDQDYVGQASTWMLNAIKGFAHRHNIWSADTFRVGDLRVKPGAGSIDPGLGALADQIAKDIPGIKQATSFNDAYHEGTGSAHSDNRAFDISLIDPSQSPVIAAKIRAELSRLGISGKVIDEYKNPSSRATAGHLHVQTDRRVDVRVLNAAGSNVVVQSSTLSAGAYPQ